jgi:hypothetical protein
VGSLLAAALQRAQAFLVEPPVPAAPVPVPTAAVPPACSEVQVVVTATSRGSGATTVARALAQALVVPGARAGHLLSLRPAPAGTRAQSGVTAWEVPPALEDPAEIARYGGTIMRLARGAGAAALVWDVQADDVPRAAGAIAAADAVVCVADGSAEPALCALVGDMLGERYGVRVLLAANRVRDQDEWSGRCVVALPDSRLAALRVGRGRPPAGGVGAAVERLAKILEEDAYVSSPTPGTNRAIHG